ncbi:MAG: class I SAM-dependent methyltransferase [Candidatus Aminicenantales bacterium]
MNQEKVGIFNDNWQQYDRWFEKHKQLYQSELKALQRFIPSSGLGLEIGVGTGRFAEPLAVKFGLDPSFNMLKLSKERRIKVVQGEGEALPFKNETFNFVLIVVTICFVSKPLQVLKEALRVLNKGGVLILGIIDRDSPWGNYYLAKATKSKFYKAARFFSGHQVINLLTTAGGKVKHICQTLWQPPPDIHQAEEPRPGFGQGGFVVFKTVKR